MNAFTLDSCPGIQAKNFLDKPFKDFKKKDSSRRGNSDDYSCKSFKNTKTSQEKQPGDLLDH